MVAHSDGLKLIKGKLNLINVIVALTVGPEQSFALKLATDLPEFFGTH